MSLRFYVGGSGSGKSTRLEEDIIMRSMKEPERQFLIIVPDQFTMQTQKEMVERHPAGGIMNIDVQSFGRLAYRVFEEVGQSNQMVLDDTGKNLILRRVAANLSEELPTIGKSLKKTGYIHEVKSVISEFMQYGLGVEEVDKLLQYSEKKPVLSSKLLDLKKIYQNFLTYLGDKYITTEERLDLLTKALGKSNQLKNSVVAFDGFTGFTPVQNRVIRQLLSMCQEVIVTIIMPAEEKQLLHTFGDEHQLFSLSRKTMHAMEQLAADCGAGRGEDVYLLEKPVMRYCNQPALAYLEENLFRNQKNPYTGTMQGITMFHAPSPREELLEVCIQIRRLVYDEHMAFRDIAVITGDLERYAPYVEELFTMYDIPVFLDNNQKLMLNPFTEFVKSGLALVQKNFSYESILHFLRSGLTGIEEAKIDEMENYLLALGIRGEKKWRRAFVKYPDYMGNDTDALGSINETRERIMQILSPLLALEKTSSAETITKAVYQFIIDNQVYEQLEGYAAMFHDNNDLVREKEYSQIYRYLMQLLEQIAALLGTEEMTLEEYQQILEAGILEIKIGVLPQDVDRVVIGDMERTRLKPIKALFFVGVNDGIIPKTGAGGGMISDIDREFLSSLGFELSPTPRQKMYIQRLYLYMALTKASDRLTLSYARMDQEGHAIRPSYLIEQMRRLFPALEVIDSTTIPIEEKICGRKDLEVHLAGMLGRYAGRNLPSEELELFYTIYDFMMQQSPEQVNKMTEASFYRYVSKPLEHDTARALYGLILENSVSRLEQYAGCAYSHFLKYGMELSEREDDVFGSVDLGNIFHHILENFGLKLEEKKLSWLEFTKEQADEILAEGIEAIAASYGDSMIYRDARTAGQIQRIQRIVHRAVMTMQYQLSKGGFVPKAFEVGFRRELELPNEKMLLRGKIDRFDTMEVDDTIYVKVVDYKSRDKKIDLMEVYYGLQLQLVVYLDQAISKVSKDNPGKFVKPAAMFYYPVMDPIMEQENGSVSQEELEQWLRKRLRVSGLFVDEETITKGLDQENPMSSDVICMERKKDLSFKAISDVIEREELNTLTHYVNKKITELGRDILGGNKVASPCGEKACTYCAFREICNFDTHIPGYEKREQKPMKKAEVLDKMRGEKA